MTEWQVASDRAPACLLWQSDFHGGTSDATEDSSPSLPCLNVRVNRAPETFRTALTLELFSALSQLCSCSRLLLANMQPSAARRLLRTILGGESNRLS